MSIYVLAQWFEGFSYSLRKRAIIKNKITFFPALIFAISFGIISECYYDVNYLFILES